jgi:uncharacterized tellurite resistance protein B-like protein
MFLHLLTEEQQRLFCRAALEVIRSDETLHDLEAEMQEAILREVRLERFPEDPLSVDDLLRSLAAFDSPVSKRVLMLELAGVATVDREIHANEETLLRRFCETLGISLDELEEFFDFTYRAHDLHDRAQGLISQREDVPDRTAGR